MGILVAWEDECGERLKEIGDPMDLLAEVLPDLEQREYRCMSYVDPYGNTTFNRLQAADVRRELAMLLERTSKDDTKKLLNEIDKLVEECEREVHTYITFYGD